ncbi:MAG: 2-oxoacid:acceptor oxidoreductase subunit alpha [Chthoniobacterales bacterium]|nr:2-oxoacid:acceptor oxidoreductase subunit alpha [Chthoniobacterales bacterium]
MGDPVTPSITIGQTADVPGAIPPTDRADLRPENIQDAVIRLAGNSQDGIQSVGAFLARLAGRSDQDVMTYMTIPSTISGGPSIFQVRMGTGEVLSAGDEADFLVAFYQHSYQDHIDFLKEGGVLLYDSDNVEPNLDDRRFVYVGVPITGLTVEALGGTAKDKGKNIFVLGLIAKVFHLDVEKLAKLIKEKFAGKDESIVNTAIMAFTAGYAYPVGNVLSKLYKFDHVVRPSGRAQITMDGNQALAYGLLAGGVRYGAGYPITPWSSVMEILRSELPKYGGIFVQSEDELAAVSTALGFSLSGYLAVTGSAGPGISLKTEAIGWASMAEMPLIIINVQRGGPSTGLPTNVEQSDLFQAIYGGHGDSPRVVLAAKDVEDCFYIAIEAARIARKYSTPVFILSDSSIATRIEAFDEPKLGELMQDPKLDLTPRAGALKPYDLERITQHVPPGARMLDGKYPLVTGLEHDEMGHPTGSPKLHMAMTAKRRIKLQKLAEKIPVPEIYGDAEGELLLVGWGSTYGPIHDAVKKGRDAAQKMAAIHLRHIHPLPNGLEQIFAKFKRIVVVEMNDQGIYGFGQLATILRARFCEPKISSVTKTDGLTYRVSEILGRVFEGKTFPSRTGIHHGNGAAPIGNGANGEAVSVARDTDTAAATERAEAAVSTATDRAGDVTPTKPGAEASKASSGKVEHSKHPPSERAEDAAVAMKGELPNK